MNMMTVIHMVLVTLAVLTIIFNAGGFVWLAKNHMRHAQESLNKLEERMEQVERGLALICGHLGLRL